MRAAAVILEVASFVLIGSVVRIAVSDAREALAAKRGER